MEKRKKYLGVHLIIELFGCPAHTLRDRHFVEEVMMTAAKESNAHTIGTFFHQFKPYGVSGVIIIEESHLSIHTWPEHGYAAIDYFYCSNEVLPERAIEIFRKKFRPEKIKVKGFKRGKVKYEAK
ncbi:MAG: adenosylmethionine decarboxylase [candidate division WOR-3 bacterium]